MTTFSITLTATVVSVFTKLQKTATNSKQFLSRLQTIIGHSIPSKILKFIVNSRSKLITIIVRDIVILSFVMQASVSLFSWVVTQLFPVAVFKKRLTNISMAMKDKVNQITGIFKK